MKITSVRVATVADARAIADIANEHELSIDSQSTLFSEQAAIDFLNGYIDFSPTHLLTLDDQPDFSVVVNLHPDSVKRRYFTDIYAKPGVPDLESVVRWTIELAESEHPEWKMWPGANFLDERLQSAWMKHGFEFLRRYYTMRTAITSAPSVREIEGVQIRTIDIANPDQIALWHALHQDSFSKHFGFAPRELENWKKLVVDDVFIDPDGVFVAFMNEKPVGFCQCTDEYAEDSKGQISIIGVAQEYQGLGIGEALLQTGISHSFAKGYSSIELNVDTGNETGALKLYEKVGFRAESSWIQLHRPTTKAQ
jgi:ribosomal protein S18 acetylase RimI-like enzyme